MVSAVFRECAAAPDLRGNIRRARLQCFLFRCVIPCVYCRLNAPEFHEFFRGSAEIHSQPGIFLIIVNDRRVMIINQPIGVAVKIIVVFQSAARIGFRKRHKDSCSIYFLTAGIRIQAKLEDGTRVVVIHSDRIRNVIRIRLRSGTRAKDNVGKHFAVVHFKIVIDFVNIAPAQINRVIAVSYRLIGKQFVALRGPIDDGSIGNHRNNIFQLSPKPVIQRRFQYVFKRLIRVEFLVRDRFDILPANLKTDAAGGAAVSRVKCVFPHANGICFAGFPI